MRTLKYSIAASIVTTLWSGYIFDDFSAHWLVISLVTALVWWMAIGPFIAKERKQSK